MINNNKSIFNYNLSVLEVSQINSYIKVLLQNDTNLKNFFVKGEVSNLKNNLISGHIYLTLKDKNSVIKAVIFSGNKQNLKFKLRDGMNILVKCSICVYEVSGQYQLNIENAQPIGIGSIYTAYEDLKNKLLTEGLFDDKIKKDIPKYPSKIGVISSETGAVIHDIENVLNRRYPICKLFLYPVKVQGDEAHVRIIKAIEYFNKPDNKADVIIIARGGGSVEDLWVFNNEELARSIIKSQIPIISAVGHETDYTICDYVADLRAPTPSAAIEMAVPDRNQLLSTFDLCLGKISLLFKSKIMFLHDDLNYKISTLGHLSPNKIIIDYIDKLDFLKKNILLNFKNIISNKKALLNELIIKCENLNYKNILSRGYSILSDNGKIIKSRESLKKANRIKVTLSDGEIELEIKNTREINNL